MLEFSTLLLIAAIVVWAAFFGSRLVLYDLTIIALYATVVTSLNLLLGLAGQASFAQTTFMAIGGYGLAVMAKTYGVNPWLAIGIAVVLSVGLALLIGKPLLRLRGHYLSMGTIAAGARHRLVRECQRLHQRRMGHRRRAGFLTIGNFTFRGSVAFLALACGALHRHQPAGVPVARR